MSTRVLKQVSDERISQDNTWGEQNHSNPHWLAILTEELGEVAECVCRTDVHSSAVKESAERQLRNELIQVAAVAVAWVESIDRKKK